MLLVALVVVCHDVEVAALLVGSGALVVLYGPAEQVTRAVVGAPGVGGRLAVMVGDGADDEVLAAARSMAQELFGEVPRTVDSLADACELAARSGTVGTPPTAIPNTNS